MILQKIFSLTQKYDTLCAESSVKYSANAIMEVPLMVSVKNISELDLMNNLRLVAGEKGLDREVLTTVILEYEPFLSDYSNFYYGNFVITSLFFAKDDPSLILKTFKELNSRNIAAVAIKSEFFKELPPEVIEFADEAELPTFFFEETYMEQVIVKLNGVVRERADYDRTEERLQKLMRPYDKREVISLADTLCPFVCDNYAIAYVTLGSGEEMDFTTYRAIFSAQRQGIDGQRFEAAKYRNGVVLIMELDTKRKAVKNAAALCMYHLNLDTANCCCGYSGEFASMKDFDIAFQQAVDANRIARLTQTQWCAYGELGFWSVICALSRSRTYMQVYNAAIAKISEYDKNYSSELFVTLSTYVKYSGKVSQTAAELHQHVNTIRYRLEKVKELIGGTDFYETVSTLIHVHEYLESCKK